MTIRITSHTVELTTFIVAVMVQPENNFKYRSILLAIQNFEIFLNQTQVLKNLAYCLKLI